MPPFFNPIAVALPLPAEFRKPAAARRLPFALNCPGCGAEFAVFISSAFPTVDVQQVYVELADQVFLSCGGHPPVIQRQ